MSRKGRGMEQLIVPLFFNDNNGKSDSFMAHLPVRYYLKEIREGFL